MQLRKRNNTFSTSKLGIGILVTKQFNFLLPVKSNISTVESPLLNFFTFTLIKDLSLKKLQCKVYTEFSVKMVKYI